MAHKSMSWHGIWTMCALVSIIMCIISGHLIAHKHS